MLASPLTAVAGCLILAFPAACQYEEPLVRMRSAAETLPALCQSAVEAEVRAPWTAELALLLRCFSVGFWLRLGAAVLVAVVRL